MIVSIIQHIFMGKKRFSQVLFICNVFNYRQIISVCNARV